MIKDIYEQKVKFDERCRETKQPRETMEQYMYTYLNQRYGLKSLIIDWAHALINGIRKYSPDDADVALFGKILQNECDEEYRLVHREVKTAISDILRSKMKKKNRLKPETDVARMIGEVLSGNIEEWLWTAIIAKMYNEEDAKALEGRIRARLAEKLQSAIKSESRKHPGQTAHRDDQLLFVEFQHVPPFSRLRIDRAYLPAIQTREVPAEVQSAVQAS